MVNGKPKCFCKEGFWGEPECDIVCPGINPITREGTQCHGHGSCYYNGQHQNISGIKSAFCACDPTYDAEGSPACEFECPRRATVQEPCSGHGKCIINDAKDAAICNCNKGNEKQAWYGKRCDCNTIYSCFGHGECNDDTGECICFNGGGIPKHVNITIYTNIENVQNTYRFKSPAHYIELDSVTHGLYNDMILNVSKNKKELPITIKTVYQSNETRYIGEFYETDAAAMFSFFNLQNIYH